jgi:aminoglycoside 3-N-acetyltransferase
VNTEQDLGHSVDRLCVDLRRLGVPEGATVLVHASMHQVRPVGRRPGAVLEALLKVIGPKGTVVVPAYTTWNSTSSVAFKQATAGMTPRQIDAHKQSLPAFDPLTTPSWRMGEFAEYVRNRPGATRSAHPQSSFAAIGVKAAELMSFHDRDCHLGERSPLGAMAAQGALVLMLGTQYSTSSAFHLAENCYRRQTPRVYECRVAAGHTGEPVACDGWTSFEDIEYDDSDFHLLGAAFERETEEVQVGLVGNAQSRLYSVRSAAAYAEAWMRKNRP